MDRYKILALLVGLLTAVSCFLPWIGIESKELVLSGMDTTGTKFGKPGLLHLVLAGIFLVFSLTGKEWGQRANLLVMAVNAAWFIRNFFMLSVCYGGECPVRMYGFYLLLAGCLGMMVVTLFKRTD
ncbi:MAG: hypothetical protein FJX92_02860 [Bacteroidetes bacterium]|nr:hypothetical protein [Bacteroidota bacterium]